MDGKLKPLAPNEVELSTPCECHGIREYRRGLEDGSVEEGLAASTGTFQKLGVTVGNYWEFEPLAEGQDKSRRTIKTDIRMTARGPSQVSSSAYRLGWDEVFGRTSAEKVVS
jgi:hypothetical protein